MADEEPYTLSPEDAGRIIGVHADTIKRWATKGQIKALKTPGGWWRFRRVDIDEYIANQQAEREVTAEAAS